MELSERQRKYWRRNLRLTVLLLVLWFVATFAFIWFARGLQAISIFGFPLPFYMAAQGSVVIYVLIVWYYARAMNKLDRDFRVAGQDTE